MLSSDFQVRFDRLNQGSLRSVLGLQDFQDALVNGSLGDDVLDHYGTGWSTAPGIFPAFQSAMSLLDFSSRTSKRSLIRCRSCRNQ